MSLLIEEQLKNLKTEKGIISGKFKHLQKDSAEYSLQLEKMRVVSEQIKRLEANLKELRHSLNEPKQPPPTPTEPFFVVSESNRWTSGFSLELLPYKAAQQWCTFISDNPQASPSHASAWMNVIEKSFGHESYVLVARSDAGHIIGGVPFTVINSPFFGRFGVSMPYLNYGGPVSEYFNVQKALMEELTRIRPTLSLKHIEVRTMQPGLGADPSSKKVSMVLRLPNTEDELDFDLGSKLRAQYKKAEEHNPSCRIGKAELLTDFYDVFSRNMRDLGTPVYPKKWFANILQSNELATHLIVVYVNAKPVSAGFLVRHGKLMEIPWASTIKSANKLNTNMWMYRKILGFAISQGCDFFDFGRSTDGAGTYKFKKQWGSQPYPHYWYTLVPEGHSKPEINPDNPKLKLFIALWKWLPVWMTKMLGPLIIKDIP